MGSRPAEEMRPREIADCAERTGCAFVPVSPAYEWHCYHLPVGTDTLIAEALCRIAAARIGGVWFRPLSFGLDEWRPDEQLEAWGFAPGDRVYGMNFPAVPLTSEYCQTAELQAAVRNRVKAIAGSGFRHVFLVNNHGGTGQVPLLEMLAGELTTPECRVHSAATYRFNDLDDPGLRVGGHAGLSETTWLLAFRPDLVDLTELEDGPLVVRETGVLHARPVVEPEHNPREASLKLAHELRECVVANFIAYVRETAEISTEFF